jgi:hypothetical protein
MAKMSASQKKEAPVELTPEQLRKLRPKMRLAMCLVVLGLVLIFSTVKDVMNGHFTETWMTTKGTIVSSSIIRVRRMQFPQKVSLHPSFIYSFAVNGQLVESKDESFDSDDEKKVGEIVSRFPEGKEITVHYVQNYPSESYFDYNGSTKHSKWRLVICLGGLALLVTAMQIMFRLRRAVKVK